MNKNDVLFERCNQALEQVMEKYESVHIKNIWRFLKLDMRLYLNSASLGLSFTILWSFLFTNSVLSVWSGYFIFLILLSIYQQFRLKECDMQEVVGGCYINSARIFCYQSVALAMIETLMLMICYLFLTFLTSVKLSEFLLNIYVPLCFSQGLLLLVIQYIRHTMIAMSMVTLSYTFTIWLINGSYWFLNNLNGISLFASFVYLFGLLKILINHREGLWN